MIVTLTKEHDRLSETSPIEVLIREARLAARRRRTAYGLTALVIVAAIVIAVGSGSIGHRGPLDGTHLGTPAHRTNSVAASALSIAPGTLLTDTTLGVGTAVDAIDMVTPQLGMGIAAASTNGKNSLYLVQTINLGNSWTVRHPLPLPALNGPSSDVQGSSIHFVNSKIGYASSIGSHLFVTNDGGTKWREVRTPGTRPNYVVAGTDVSVVSELCSRPVLASRTSQCQGYFSQYRLGATTPLRTRRTPDDFTAAGRIASILMADGKSTAVGTITGAQGQLWGMFKTSNSGESWQPLSNPCQRFSVDQLLAPAANRWLLYCFQFGAMSQGVSGLWTSSNQGASWSVLSYSSQVTQPVNQVGNIGDQLNVLGLSGNEKVLFSAIVGAAGGIAKSSDGGVQWSPVGVNLDTGGAPEYLSTFGSSGVVIGVAGGLVERTVDGVNWTRLPSLSAGKFRDLSICTPGNGVNIKSGNLVQGSGLYEKMVALNFINNGNSACYLNGAPTAQSVTGVDRNPVGPVLLGGLPFAQSPFVVLRPHGGTASAIFTLIVGGYPRSYCLPRTMTGLTLRFASPSSFYVATHHWRYCTGASFVGVSAVTAGLAPWQ